RNHVLPLARPPPRDFLPPARTARSARSLARPLLPARRTPDGRSIASLRRRSAAIPQEQTMYPLRNCLLTLLFVLALTSAASAADLLAHAPNPDTTPTYDGTGQVVEPDVIHVPRGWNGYEYWMAVTPYPCGDESLENPSILVSHDG